MASIPLIEQVKNSSKDKIPNKKLTDPVEVEAVVRAYFADTPILAEIARCESHFNQFNPNGTIFEGEITPSDAGVMQVNRFYHQATAKKLGFDILTLEGNMAYAKYLYQEQGVQPWSASAPCWKKVSKLLVATTLK